MLGNPDIRNRRLFERLAARRRPVARKPFGRIKVTNMPARTAIVPIAICIFSISPSSEIANAAPKMGPLAEKPVFDVGPKRWTPSTQSGSVHVDLTSPVKTNKSVTGVFKYQGKIVNGATIQCIAAVVPTMRSEA